MTLGTFSVDLNAFARKAKENADGVVRLTLIGLQEEIDWRSPVGNPSLWKSPPPAGYVGGRFRGNWQLGIDQVPLGETGRIDPDGEATRGEFRARIPDEAGGHVYWITNNVPYAMRLEFESWSSQAPQGIVGLTAESFESKVQEAATLLDR